LTRLILKSYAPIKFPENLEPGPPYSFLPTCVQLKIQFPSSAPPPVRRDGTRMIIGLKQISLRLSRQPHQVQLRHHPLQLYYQSQVPPGHSLHLLPLLLSPCLQLRHELVIFLHKISVLHTLQQSPLFPHPLLSNFPRQS
jgi:hypothetical protein